MLKQLITSTLPELSSGFTGVYKQWRFWEDSAFAQSCDPRFARYGSFLPIRCLLHLPTFLWQNMQPSCWKSLGYLAKLFLVRQSPPVLKKRAFFKLLEKALNFLLTVQACLLKRCRPVCTHSYCIQLQNIEYIKGKSLLKKSTFYTLK